MKLAAAICATTLLTACATQPYPMKRPLTPEVAQQLGATDVVLVEPNEGIMASWFAQDSSAAGASYGLIGALTTAVIDGIANAGPSARATRVASEIHEAVDTDHITASLIEAFTVEPSETEITGVTYAAASSRQSLLDKTVPSDVIHVVTSYALAENAGAFSVSATVTIDAEEIAYVTPYTFEDSVPKEQLTGPIYKNTFTYNSKQFPMPALTDAIKEELAQAIEAFYRDPDGNLPEADSKQARTLTKELEKARDDDFTKSEASVFMANNWVADDGAALKAELKNAHTFFAEYVLFDLNNPSVPSLEGVDEILNTADDGRVVILTGAGTMAGSYLSQPGGVDAFVTYGNARAIAPKANERMKSIRNNKDGSS